MPDSLDSLEKLGPKLSRSMEDDLEEIIHSSIDSTSRFVLRSLSGSGLVI